MNNSTDEIVGFQVVECFYARDKSCWQDDIMSFLRRGWVLHGEPILPKQEDSAMYYAQAMTLRSGALSESKQSVDEDSLRQLAIELMTIFQDEWVKEKLAPPFIIDMAVHKIKEFLEGNNEN